MAYEKDLCVIHANCQAEPLMELLALAPDFSRLFAMRHYTNYLREEIPQADLDNCRLFIYQHLDESWGEHASAALTARLNPAAEAICLPNMFFKGYWPFWTSASPIDFGDSLLDRLLDADAQKPEIIKIYYHGDLDKFVDIKATAEESLAIEEEKDLRSPIKVAPIVREFWRDELLFYTCNHPARRLLGSVAGQLLRILGLGGIAEKDFTAFTPEYANFELPIHPQVARDLELKFVGPDQQFGIFGRRLTFLQYISRYIDCRQQGFQDAFLGYLQLI